MRVNSLKQRCPILWYCFQCFGWFRKFFLSQELGGTEKSLGFDIVNLLTIY